jgi:DNA-binding TFAR19-related protein (PDSD5 family)
MPRVSPDRAALEVAHIKLCTTAPLDEMLKDPSLKIILESLARRHMQRRSWVDVKKLQANDKE